MLMGAEQRIEDTVDRMQGCTELGVRVLGRLR